MSAKKKTRVELAYSGADLAYSTDQHSSHRVAKVFIFYPINFLFFLILMGAQFLRDVQNSKKDK